MTVGAAKIPIPSVPKSFANALSSNSPTTLGWMSWELNHCSNALRTAEGAPGRRNGVPSRERGNLRRVEAASLGAAKKVVPHSPRRWLKARIGIHTHNDCGFGVANAIAGVEAGAGGFHDVGDIFEAFGDMFGDLFGGGRRSAGGPRARKGESLQTSLTIELLDAAVGCTRELQIEKHVL